MASGATSGTAQRWPAERLWSTTPRSPASIRSWIIWLPIYPAPPVTRTALRCILRTLNSSSRYCQLHVVLPAVTLQQRKQYYRESQFFAGLFGIPKECLPQDWAGFADYFP